MDEEKNIWISTPISFNHIYDKVWKEQYVSHFETKMEEINITIDEAIDKYGIRIEKIGYNRGILFNRVAMKIDKMGNYKVVEYLPRGCNSKKNDVDFYINIVKGRDYI